MTVEPTSAWSDRLCELAQRLLNAPLYLAPGWPRHISLAPAECHQFDTWLHFESAREPERRGALRLDAGLALTLVERVLGAEDMCLPSGHCAARLTDSELGVLAYLTARCLNELDSPWLLRAVEFAPPPTERGRPWLCWPWQVGLGAYRAGAHFWAAPCPASGSEPFSRWPCRWVIAAEARDPGPVCVGDIWVLKYAASPYRGWLRLVAGDGVCWPAAYNRSQLRARSGRGPATGAATLEQPGDAVTLERLAEFHAGHQLRWFPEEVPAELRDEGRCLARGELVQRGPNLGLRILELGA